jgi:hypothetical protein
MGCCFCHLRSRVEGDSTVTAPCEVVEIVILRERSCSVHQGGLLYIQGDSLHYEQRCSDTCLWCSCIRKHYRLTEINRVEFIEDEALKYNQEVGVVEQMIQLSPGVRFTLSIQNTTVLVSMADAANFCQHLKGTCKLE